MKIRITNRVSFHPQVKIGEIYEAKKDSDGDFIFYKDGVEVLAFPEECEVVEDSEESWIEALFKELSRLGCYDIKFEKDSKFHKDFFLWSREVASQIQIKLDNPLPNYLVTGAKLRGINVEVIDRELLKESDEKVVVNGIGRDDDGRLVSHLDEPVKEDLYQITFVSKDSELNFVGVGSPRVEGLDVFIMSPDNKQAVVDKSKFLYFVIEPYSED